MLEHFKQYRFNTETLEIRYHTCLFLVSISISPIVDVVEVQVLQLPLISWSRI